MKQTPNPTRQLPRLQHCFVYDCLSISAATSLALHPSSVNCRVFLIRFKGRSWSPAPPSRPEDDNPNRLLGYHWTHNLGSLQSTMWKKESHTIKRRTCELQIGRHKPGSRLQMSFPCTSIVFQTGESASIHSPKSAYMGLNIPG